MSQEPRRYLIEVLIGPCSEEEMKALAVTIAELPEARAVGAGVGVDCRIPEEGE